MEATGKSTPAAKANVVQAQPAPSELTEKELEALLAEKRLQKEITLAQESSNVRHVTAIE